MDDFDPSQHPALDVADPSSDRTRALLTIYIEDVAGRYYGRPLTQAERVRALADLPGDDLAEPRGVLLIARLQSEEVGCVGIRFLDCAIGEVTSLFVLEGVRGRGIGALLLSELEAIAVSRGMRALRLETRHDLIEARRLYARQGFREVPAFNNLVCGTLVREDADVVSFQTRSAAGHRARRNGRCAIPSRGTSLLLLAHRNSEGSTKGCEAGVARLSLPLGVLLQGGHAVRLVRTQLTLYRRGHHGRTRGEAFRKPG